MAPRYEFLDSTVRVALATMNPHLSTRMRQVLAAWPPGDVLPCEGEHDIPRVFERGRVHVCVYDPSFDQEHDTRYRLMHTFGGLTRFVVLSSLAEHCEDQFYCSALGSRHILLPQEYGDPETLLGAVEGAFIDNVTQPDTWHGNTALTEAARVLLDERPRSVSAWAVAEQDYRDLLSLRVPNPQLLASIVLFPDRVDHEPPPYRSDGPYARFTADKRMLARVDTVVTFWDGRSIHTGYTWHLAQRIGLPCEIVRVEEQG